MLRNFSKFFEDRGISVGLLLIIAFAVLFTFVPRELLASMARGLLTYAPIWLSVLLFLTLKILWMNYVQTKRFTVDEYKLLEVKLPREITQSPLAMETALNAFFYTGEPDTPWAKYLGGQIRAQFSLELVSFEGEVHFYIWTREKMRNVIEANLYAHYPTIEIYEVEDYMPRIPFDRSKMNLYGIEQKLEKPDPYPIKTYVDFGLDRADTEDEYKTDPMASILEYLGSLGKGETMLFQLIIRSHQAEKHKPGSFFGTEDWKEEAAREKEKILSGIRAEKGETVAFRALTEGEKDLIASLERNTGKKPFDAGVRLLYLAELEHYRKDRHQGLPTIMRNFQHHTLNNFKPKFFTFSFPWEDPFGWRVEANKRELYTAYRWRSYLAPPYKRSYAFVLSSEELATVYHFPGRVGATPTIGRITSRRAEPPPNLPAI